VTSWNRVLLCIAVFLTLAVVGCASGRGPSVTPAPSTYTDPFAYCAAVGNIDAPDARWAGPAVPESIAKGLQTALDAPDTPIDILTRGSCWRCMNGKVYGCFVGANLPCTAKANTARTPTQEEKDFCAQNPNADVIPMVVTGRETVYEWRCSNGVPEITRQLDQPDARGFLSSIWHEISEE